jgi:hypothetical protein
MVKRAVSFAATLGGLMLTTFPVCPVSAEAQLSPTAGPSAMARSDIPPKYLSYYIGAAKTCPGLPWQVLAGIGSIESDHGRSSAPDVHGPVGYGSPEGPMQFEAPTFAYYAVRTDKDSPANPYNPKDAIYSAARMLCANGGRSPSGLYQAIYQYNHAGWYVNDVLNRAQRYSGPPPAKPAGHPAPVAHPQPSARPGPAPKPKASHAGAHSMCSPDRIRTGVTALRGRRPRPLDDGAVPCPNTTRPGPKPAISSGVQTTASPPARPTGTPATPITSPTPTPTTTPSTAPTPAPTAASMPAPTVTPTTAPTPGATPSAPPSASPTPTPTAFPSSSPSVTPTTMPIPSAAPSPSPSGTPSV